MAESQGSCEMVFWRQDLWQLTCFKFGRHDITVVNTALHSSKCSILNILAKVKVLSFLPLSFVSMALRRVNAAESLNE